MEPEKVYRPTSNGYEHIIAKRLTEWDRMRAEKRQHEGRADNDPSDDGDT
ncbi:hypothetical protein BAURA86_02465 [Brevibacterium aurantiacum]|uniref:Uncharacterized protein n=2 Tax=Brevibacterium TaxID=1696 RepID=A0A2H1K6H0_BREAU|nr:hypothetical protein [Brevibacterium aurantiacum]SMX95286.1 hypothetical protein BAURA86_02465 [Brevibacterium aurantiacum]